MVMLLVKYITFDAEKKCFIADLPYNSRNTFPIAKGIVGIKYQSVLSHDEMIISVDDSFPKWKCTRL